MTAPPAHEWSNGSKGRLQLTRRLLVEVVILDSVTFSKDIIRSGFARVGWDQDGLASRLMVTVRSCQFLLHCQLPPNIWGPTTAVHWKQAMQKYAFARVNLNIWDGRWSIQGQENSTRKMQHTGTTPVLPTVSFYIMVGMVKGRNSISTILQR